MWIDEGSLDSKSLHGVDIFLDWVDKDGESRNPEVLGKILDNLPVQNLKLKMVSNRGQKVYPGGNPSTYCTDHWRCRYLKKQDAEYASYADVIKVMEAITNAGLNIIKTENLYEIDGQRAYSLGQGE